MKSYTLVMLVVLIGLYGWVDGFSQDSQKPTASKPAAGKPAASKPAAAKPSAGKPAASKPSTSTGSGSPSSSPLTDILQPPTGGSFPNLPGPVDAFLPLLRPILQKIGAFLPSIGSAFQNLESVLQTLATAWTNLVAGIGEIVTRFFSLVNDTIFGTPAILTCLAESSLLPQLVSFFTFALEKFISVFVPLLEIPFEIFKPRI